MRPTPILLALAALLVQAPAAAGYGSHRTERSDCTPSDDEREQRAAALAEKAGELARKGKYKDARRTYARVVSRYPETKAAVTAKRRSAPSAFLGWVDLVRNGPSANRVDVVIMGEAYELGHQGTFDNLAADLPIYFERQRTFREYFAYFNFQRANLISADGYVDGFGREYDTALGGKTLDTYAGHIGVDRKLVRAMLDEMPEHDGQAIVFTRVGVGGTGGGGVATIAGHSIRTAIHEFGHSFGGLSDEYASETHDRGAARDGINVAASEDPESAPWKHWIEAGVPGIGMYEGASGRVRGAWKPTSGGCVMESGEFFCRVCQEALVLRIYRHVDPIDRCQPLAHLPDTKGSLDLGREGLEFEVGVMRPAEHRLQVSWWVVPEEQAPLSGRARRGTGTGRYRTRGDRRDRGRLPVIAAEPRATSKGTRSGVHRFRLRRSDLEPGRYRVIVRVRDSTEWRGEKWPWVLEDEFGLLESERGWWVRVAADQSLE